MLTDDSHKIDLFFKKAVLSAANSRWGLIG